MTLTLFKERYSKYYKSLYFLFRKTMNLKKKKKLECD